MNALCPCCAHSRAARRAVHVIMKSPVARVAAHHHVL